MDGGEGRLSSGSPTAQRRLSKVYEFAFSELVLQDVKTLDLAESSSVLGQLRQCLLGASQPGCMGSELCSCCCWEVQEPFPGSRALEEVCTCLIYHVPVSNL